MDGEFQDETIVCQDCGKEFVFTAGEQAFYKEKGLQNKPKRCPECRQKRKKAKIARQEVGQTEQPASDKVEQPKREF